MKLLGVLLLACLATASPTTKDDDKIVVTKDFYLDEFAIHTSQHDIVNIFVPLNALNNDENNDDDTTDSDMTIFFVEADIKENGEKDYKGLYVFKNKQAKKLLDNGVDSTSAGDETKDVYFAATDGIYVYNAEKDTAEKYGTLTDNIIDIAREQNKKDSDVLYILTKNHELFKVTERGTKKTKIEEVEDAQQFIVDYANNIYFYAEDNVPFVLVDGEVKKIEGLPEKPSEVILLRPPFVLDDGGIPALVNDKSYFLYPNGTSDQGDFIVQAKPTAYSMEAGLVQYYAYNKKIYEYNILVLALSSVLEDLQHYLEEKKDVLQSTATRSKTKVGPKTSN